MEGKHVVTSVKDVADFFRTSSKTVKGWISQGAPRTEISNRKYEYDLYLFQGWCLDNIWRPKVNQWDEDEDDDLTELRKEKLRIENADRQLKLDERTERLVNRETIKAALRMEYAEIRARIEAIPEEVAASVPPQFRAEVIADLKHKIRLILKEMSGHPLNDFANG